MSTIRRIIAAIARLVLDGAWPPGLWTGGLSALESAFEALGWGVVHPCPDLQCDEPGCREQSTCGTPTTTGYRRTCGEHMPEATR